MEKARKLVVLSQVSFLIFIGICAAILPHFLFERNEGGMSNFGVHAATVVFYTMAFTLPASSLLYASHALPQTNTYRALRNILLTTAYSLVAVLVTTYPYQRSDLYGNLHIAANIWLFCFEMLAGGYIALIFYRKLVSILLLALQLLAFVLLVLTFIGTIHLLFVAQLLTFISFSSLLVVGTSTLSAEK